MNTMSTWVEVDLDAFASNLRHIRRRIGPEVKVHLVVKADAYGHGAPAIARVAETEGVHSLGVATLDEGVELRTHGVRAPVIILSPTLPTEAERVVEFGLTPTVGNPSAARAVADASRSRGVTTDVHVEVDTGMGRSGVASGEAVAFCAALAELEGLRLAGMFTHFPKADSPNGTAMVNRQLEDFRAVADAVRTAGLEPGVLHASNSSALLFHPSTHLDMVRPGLIAFGLTTAGAHPNPEGFQPVMRFVSRLVHEREMPPGHPISYGGDFVTPETMRVGTASVGYGHGYPFALSGRGYALLRGHRIPILGRVTMDTTVFDLRGVPEARLGDEVVLFGSQGDETIHVNDLAALAGTLPYEILIGIGRRVPRIYIRSGRKVGARTLLGVEDAS